MPKIDSAVDMAVVGGGVIGCSVAYHAAWWAAKGVLSGAEGVGSGALPGCSTFRPRRTGPVLSPLGRGEPPPVGIAPFSPERLMETAKL